MALSMEALIGLLTLIVTGPPSLLIFLQYIRKRPSATSNEHSLQDFGSRVSGPQQNTILITRRQCVHHYQSTTHLAINPFIDPEDGAGFMNARPGEFTERPQRINLVLVAHT